MFSFQFDTILSMDDYHQLKNGFYIWIWYADKIPPHIGCSSNGNYFSLKVKGKDKNVFYYKVISLLNSKEIPSILIHLKNDVELNDVAAVFDKYSNVGIGVNTCLTPILDILDCEEKIGQLSELLKYLTKRGLIESVFGLNLSKEYIGIPDYTKEDIQNRLLKLENAKSEKNIPSVS